MNKTGFALIGYGGMGSWHINNLLTMDEIKVCGVYDIKPERMELAHSKGLYTYSSLDELLSDGEVSLVTVATPNDLHEELVIKALSSGKNVISEKPVTTSVKSLKRMIAASEKYCRMFSVHQNRRFDEDFLQIKKIYDENELGHVFNIESRVHGSRGVPGDWRNQKAHGGGMVFDWGVHLIDQILWMVHEPVCAVYATLDHVTNDEVDDGFKIILTFKSGLHAHIEVGTSNFISLPRWYMCGENGSCVVESNWHDGKITKVSDWENRDAVPVVTAAGLTKTMAPRTDDTIKIYPLPEINSDVKDYYRNFIGAIEGRNTQFVTHAEMLRVFKVMEAVFRSAEANEVIKETI